MSDAPVPTGPPPFDRYAGYNVPANDGRNETEAVRVDRNYNELLQEIRVSQTGVQILFAFLLVISFQPAFSNIGTFERTIFVITLLSCTAAFGVLIAPVVFHRVVFRRGMKPELVRATAKLALVGIGFLLFAVLGSILLILDHTVGRAFAITTCSVVGVGLLTLWVGLPLLEIRRDHELRMKSRERR